MSTQRRLTSLEADLAAAERREVERKNGAKYHKVCPRRSMRERVLTVLSGQVLWSVKHLSIVFTQNVDIRLMSCRTSKACSINQAIQAKTLGL